ncbi:MAG: AAA family ATPase, partial [Candidatus Edwardsbacteria bacterium]|nr:AAA family ATPase [Candidatus Edwardsbacteria bacterium]
MYIKGIDVSNFKCFQFVDVGNRNLRIEDLSGINIFIGKNNAGKSTILQALYYALNDIPNKNEYNINNYKNNIDKDVCIYIKFRLSTEDIDTIPREILPSWEEILN